MRQPTHFHLSLSLTIPFHPILLPFIFLPSLNPYSVAIKLFAVFTPRMVAVPIILLVLALLLPLPYFFIPTRKTKAE